MCSRSSALALLQSRGESTLIIPLCVLYSFATLTPSLISRVPRVYVKKLALGIFRTNKSLVFSFSTQSTWKSIVLHNPFQGIYIEGSAGSGKSKSIIEPIISQAVAQGYAGFLYDFKGNPPTLSSCMYGAIAKSKVRTQFAHINLGSPVISHRCNPLSPNYFPHKYYAHEYASVILKNLNKEWARKIDFWAENAIAYLAAILWYLRKHHPQLCSLPHATLLAMETPEKSLSLLNRDGETKRMVDLLPKNWSKVRESFVSLKPGPIMKDKFSIPQIIRIIKEQESGIRVPELCRKHSIGQSTFYRWKALYGGMSVSEAQRLKHLEAENSKLKRLVADLSLDKVMLQEVLSKKA